MLIQFSNWENKFGEDIWRKKPTSKDKPGALLQIVPDHSKWEEFLSLIKDDWRLFLNNLYQHPACLILLYSGMAFYEYEDNTFWPQFAKSVGIQPIPQNIQNEINIAFAKAIECFGLPLKHRINGTDYVGSAIHFVGIPLSLWDGFLEICEWALWRKDWNSLTDEEWADAVEKRSIGRKRLNKFLNNNRESARAFIQEMIDARGILSTNLDLTIKDIEQASILRVEYFEEVPETADFLRPKNPDSLLQDRANLIWDENKKEICLHLPAVKRDKLPATWKIGEYSQKAASTPDVLTLNAEAFHKRLLLNLESCVQCETQRLRGLELWGLFDKESRGRIVNPDRDELPLRSYCLVSLNEIEILSRKGFDEEDNPANERFELGDGTPCYVTNLWPTGKSAELLIKDRDNDRKKILFKTKSRIEAIFIVGFGQKAAYFHRIEGKIEIDHLPILCIAIPEGYFIDVKKELSRNFKVFINDIAANGQWEPLFIKEETDKDFYKWKWNDPPYLEPRPSINMLRSLASLGDAFRPPDLGGDRTITIEAKPHIREKFETRFVHGSGGEVDNCWENLPGKYLPMFLLCHSLKGMTLEEIQFEKEVIAPDLPFSSYILKKYMDWGFLTQSGRRWFIRETRAELILLNKEKCQLNFCGDPSILWNLYRKMYRERHGGYPMPIINVIDKRGEVPYLQMSWPHFLQGKLAKYLIHNNVIIGSLWTL